MATWTERGNLKGPQGDQGPTGSTGSTGAAGADGKTVRSGTTVPGGDLGVDGDFYIRTSDWTLYGPKTGGSWGSPTSLIGPEGPQGDPGATGSTGSAGAAGADGKTVRSGSGAPDNSLGVDGDFYVRTSNWTIYGPKTGGAWGSATSLIGPQGETGATGETGSAGTPGADGKTVRSGSGAPAGGLGVDGDFYIRTDTHELYGPKTGGSWGSPTSLVGPQGDEGPQGDPGTPGADGSAPLTTKGDLLTRSSSAVSRLGVGTNGQALLADDAQTLGVKWATLVKGDVGLGNVDNTSDANKPISTATQAALDGKQASDSDLTAFAGLSPTNDDIVQRKSGAWTNRTMTQLKTDLALVKGDVGLGNVDNTSDANKPISTATQTALDGKQASDSDLTAIAGISPTNDDIIQRKSGVWVARSMSQLKTDLALSKSDVGLGNVDNTSDANKPISTATQTALNNKQAADTDLTQIASLTATSDNFIQSNLGQWSSRTPAQAKATLALVKADVGLGNVDNTSDANKPISTATQAALDAKQASDSDLTAFAGLSPTNDDIVQRKSGAWTNRTMAQLKTDLALVKGDVGLGNVDNTSDANKPVSTATQSALDAKQPLDAELTALAGLTSAANKVPYYTGSGTASLADLTAFARTLLDDADAATALGTLGAQPLDATLTALAAVTTAANKLIYATGSDAFTTADLTAFGRTLMAVADAAAARTAIGAQAAGSYQTQDADLDAIAALSPSDDDILQRKGGVWVSRTLAQLRADLPRRVFSTASASTLTPVASDYDQYCITALAAGLTINADAGSPYNGQPVTFRFKDNGTARALTWNAAYRALGITLPTTTTISKTLYVSGFWNSTDSVYDMLAVGAQG